MQNLDEKYSATEHYWERGWLGSVYQFFLDANEIVEKGDLSENEKQTKKNKILEARKNALGSSYKLYPPWSLGM